MTSGCRARLLHGSYSLASGVRRKCLHLCRQHSKTSGYRASCLWACLESSLVARPTVVVGGVPPHHRPVVGVVDVANQDGLPAASAPLANWLASQGWRHHPIVCVRSSGLQTSTGNILVKKARKSGTGSWQLFRARSESSCARRSRRGRCGLSCTGLGPLARLVPLGAGLPAHANMEVGSRPSCASVAESLSPPRRCWPGRVAGVIISPTPRGSGWSPGPAPGSGR